MKAFLPQIAQANEDLKKTIESQGSDSIRIDTCLDSKKPTDNHDANDDSEADSGDDESNEVDDTDEVNRDDNKDDTIKSQPQKKVKLEFVIGDIDDTVYAQIDKDEEQDEYEGETCLVNDN